MQRGGAQAAQKKLTNDLLLARRPFHVFVASAHLAGLRHMIREKERVTE